MRNNNRHSQLMSAGTRYILHTILLASLVFKGCNIETAAFEWSDPTGKELFMQSAVVHNTRCVGMLSQTTECFDIASSVILGATIG